MKRLSYCVSILLIYIEKSYCVPEPNPGEKIKFNAEDFEKLAKYANLTKRDHTAKNVNFAWKVTMGTTITTTTDPRHTSTLNEELSKKNSEIYDKLFAQLAYTLRDKVYLDRWLNEMDKGYHIFLYELQKQDKYHFVKNVPSHDIFNDPKDGENYWKLLIDFAKGLKSRVNFMKFLETIQIDGTLSMKVPTSDEAEDRQTVHTYYLMLMQFVLSWKDPIYKSRWVTALKKGYPNFLREIDIMGYKFFIKIDKKDTTFIGAGGELYWLSVKGFLHTLKYEAFEEMMQKIDTMPQMKSVEDLIFHFKNAKKERYKLRTIIPQDDNDDLYFTKAAEINEYVDHTEQSTTEKHNIKRREIESSTKLTTIETKSERETDKITRRESGSMETEIINDHEEVLNYRTVPFDRYWEAVPKDT